MNGSPPAVRRWLSDQLFEHVPIDIVVIDRDYRIVAANHQFREIFGDAVGKRCYEVCKHRESVCAECLAEQTFSDAQAHVHDEEGIDRDGKPVHHVVYTAPVYGEDDTVTHVIEMSHDVTETRALQRQYNLLFERAPCYISVIDRNLRVVRANERVRQTFGEQVGEFCFKAYKQRETRCPDCPALKTFADGNSHQSQHTGVDKNGQATYYAVSTAPLARSNASSGHVIELSTDVTAIHDLSLELERESSFQRILIESSLDALVALDTTGKVTIFNDGAADLFGVSAEEVVGKATIERFVPQQFLRAVEKGDDRLSLAETVVVSSSGEEIPVRFSGSVLRDGQQVIGSAAFYQDLRERKRLEQENLDNERLAAVGQTVAQLAHGIKNILNGLQGGMYIVRSGMRSNSQARVTRGWEMLERNVNRITVLVKGFLSFAKGHTPEVKPTDPAAVAEEIYELYRDTAAEKGILLKWEPGAKIAPAPMDPEDIHTCLANLVSNAIDACRSSERMDCTVEMRVEEKDGVVIYSVRDSGCGMDYKIKSTVFTAFFTTKGSEGTGLGLLATRKIVQEHGGYIDVDSTPGEGSTFVMRFPRSRLPQPGTSPIGEGDGKS